MTTMTTSEPNYHTLGIRTWRGAHWWAVFFATLVVTMVIKALFMTVWCPDSRSVESNCGIPRG